MADDTKTVQLQPCPFCGGAAQLSSCADYSEVFCQNCGASTCSVYYSIVCPKDPNEIAEKRWQRRVPATTGA